MGGRPEDVLPPLMKELDITRLSFEFDTEPYWKDQGEKVAASAKQMGASVHCPTSHTLFDPKHFPKEFIYEPWKAPIAVQKKAGCIVGVDYPKPIVDHAEAVKANKSKMAAAYA